MLILPKSPGFFSLSLADRLPLAFVVKRLMCLVFDITLFQLENLERETIKWCREILRNSPTAIRVLKSALNAVDDGHAGLQVIQLINS